MPGMIVSAPRFDRNRSPRRATALSCPTRVSNALLELPTSISAESRVVPAEMCGPTASALDWVETPPSVDTPAWEGAFPRIDPSGAET